MGDLEIALPEVFNFLEKAELSKTLKKLKSELQEKNIKVPSSETPFALDLVEVLRRAKRRQQKKHAKLQTPSTEEDTPQDKKRRHSAIEETTSFKTKPHDYAAKAAQDLGRVKGKDFRKEMQKKKRSSWKGNGLIEVGAVNSISFDD